MTVVIFGDLNRSFLPYFALLYMRCVAFLLIGHMALTDKRPINDYNDDDEDGDGSRQQRIESKEPNIGHIAGAVVAVLLIIAIVLVIVSLPTLFTFTNVFYIFTPCILHF